MIVAAVRELADWLSAAPAGVNAQLATVPRDVGDPVPPSVTVHDETRESWVARGVVPRGSLGNGPLLIIRGPDDLQLPLWTDQGSGGFTPLELRVGYVRRAAQASVDTDDALRDCYQTLRAAARVIALKYQTPLTGVTRTQVTLDRPTVQLLRAVEALEGEELILAQLAVSFPAVDPWAMATTS